MLFPAVHEAKAAGLLQYSKFANRSAIQLTIAPVLATLASYTTMQRQSSSSRRTTPPTASTPNPNALRNITNSQSTGASTAAARRAAAPTPAKAASQSTLAQLSSLNASNLPLASHQRRRYGLAATQQREQQQQVQNTQRAADSAWPTDTDTQAARKRKLTQQNS